jgi:RNA polymerase-binding transcription factor DksA
MIELETFKTLLVNERSTLEQELDKLGRRDSTSGENWDIKIPEMDVLAADENELADMAEELQIDSIVLDELEIRYRLVLAALERMEHGSYGLCEVCGDEIDQERLHANPAAPTCRTHLNQDGSQDH